MSNILASRVVIIWLALTLSMIAHAQDPAASYPSRPLRFIVTYEPGGGTDIVARQVGEKLTSSLGQQVVVDNRPGAGGMIGTAIVASAPPDGQTILLGTSSGLVTQPLLTGKATYDPLTSFAPVSLLTVDEQTFYVSASLPVNTLKEFIAYAKAKPGTLSYASAGPGTPNHLNMEIFKRAAGIDLTHVPYKGSAPSTSDLIAGRVQAEWGSTAALVQLSKEGKIKALAAGGPKRLAVLPNVPTTAEAGMPQLELNVPWFSIFAPAKTPKPIIAKLNGQVVRSLSESQTVNQLAKLGYTAQTSTPEELDELLHKEFVRVKALLAVLKLDPNQAE